MGVNITCRLTYTVGIVSEFCLIEFMGAEFSVFQNHEKLLISDKKKNFSKGNYETKNDEISYCVVSRSC